MASIFTTILLFLVSLSLLLPPSSSVDNSPQNIETYYSFPTGTIPAVQQPPPPPPPLISVAPALAPLNTLPTGSPSSSSSDKKATVAKAVVATAASTLVLSAVLFLVLHRASARRRENKSMLPARGENPYSSYDTRVSRDAYKFDGPRLKGLIIDENGLDVLYWRKLESGGHKKISGSFQKKNVLDEQRHGRGGRSREGEEDDDDGGGGGTRRSSNKYSNRVQELPLLSSDSLNSTHRQRLLGEASDMATANTLLFPPLPLPPIRPPVATTTFASIAAAPSAPPPPPAAPPRPPVPPPPPETAVKKDPSPPPPPFPRTIAPSATPLPPPPAAPPSPPAPPPPPITSVKKDPSPPPPPPPPFPRTIAPSAPPPPPPPRSGGSAASSSSRPPPVPFRTVSRGRPENSSKGRSDGGEAAEQAKLKPLHWDKVNANADHSMVWDKLGSGSFHFDNDLMEALFGYVATNRKSNSTEATNATSAAGQSNPAGGSGASAQTFILDPRKSQNTAIVLRSLAISRQEIQDALLDGQGLSSDALEKLTKIAPSDEEEARILDFSGNPSKLADADSFLYHLLQSVRSPFKRLDAMFFKATYDSDVQHLKDSLQTLELACKELRSRGLFLKLLEAVLKAGNRLNAGTARGNARAFNLTALKKLSDVKSTDGKTTLLHFVVEEVVRSEGKKCALNMSNNSFRSGPAADISSEEKDYILLGLPVVGGLSVEFGNVKKAAGVDYDSCAATCSMLEARVGEIRQFVEGVPAGEGGGFVKRMRDFLDEAEEELKTAREDEKTVMEIVRKTYDYYQSGASKEKGFHQIQLFVIVKDFLAMVDKVCVDITRNHQQKKRQQQAANGGRSSEGSSPEHHAAMKFPVLPAHFLSDNSKSSSDSEENFD